MGPQLEQNLRRAMLISGGDFTVFVSRPISAVLLGLAVTLILVLMPPAVLRARKEVLVEKRRQCRTRSRDAPSGPRRALCLEGGEHRRRGSQEQANLGHDRDEARPLHDPPPGVRPWGRRRGPPPTLALRTS
jgi:hypothetical protein